MSSFYRSDLLSQEKRNDEQTKDHDIWFGYYPNENGLGYQLVHLCTEERLYSLKSLSRSEDDYKPTIYYTDIPNQSAAPLCAYGHTSALGYFGSSLKKGEKSLKAGNMQLHELPDLQYLFLIKAPFRVEDPDTSHMSHVSEWTQKGYDNAFILWETPCPSTLSKTLTKNPKLRAVSLGWLDSDLVNIERLLQSLLYCVCKPSVSLNVEMELEMVSCQLTSLSDFAPPPEKEKEKEVPANTRCDSEKPLRHRRVPSSLFLKSNLLTLEEAEEKDPTHPGPEEMSLKQLLSSQTTLDLSENPLRRFPVYIASLYSHIEYLNLSLCDLKELPDCLHLLPRLKVFCLFANPLLMALPLSLLRLIYGLDVFLGFGCAFYLCPDNQEPPAGIIATLYETLCNAQARERATPLVVRNDMKKVELENVACFRSNEAQPSPFDSHHQFLAPKLWGAAIIPPNLPDKKPLPLSQPSLPFQCSENIMDVSYRTSSAVRWCHFCTKPQTQYGMYIFPLHLYKAYMLFEMVTCFEATCRRYRDTFIEKLIGKDLRYEVIVPPESPENTTENKETQKLMQLLFPKNTLTVPSRNEIINSSPKSPLKIKGVDGKIITVSHHQPSCSDYNSGIKFRKDQLKVFSPP
jgi:serine/threonine protein kinase